MREVVLSDAACCLIGLVPGGPVEPAVYGIAPVRRLRGGWAFLVTEQWRLEVLRAVVHRLYPDTSTPSIGRAIIRRLRF